MSTTFRFHQLDVFTATPLKGNPLAVVHGADALDAAQMQAFATWTNLSETTFLLAPTAPGADYRVRIFTPVRELPFAGHPTLGSCHAWLAAGGKPHGAEIVQQCAVGPVRIRRDVGRLAFAAPPLVRSGAVEPAVVDRIARSLRIAPDALRATQWVDNGPGWVAALLDSREAVLALKPDLAAMGDLEIGVVGPWPATEQDEAHFEVRAFVPSVGVGEDPVTGSLNASLAQWLIGADIWIGGHTVVCVDGQVTL